jgi:tetratricopeptide (TPR) repeat protein
MVFSSPAQSVVMMTKGDELWKKGESDEAADDYRAAIKLDPTDWRTYERLSVVTAYMSMFNESLTALEQLKKVQPDPPSYTVESRYNLYRKAIDQQFAMLLRQYESDSDGYADGKITRETYYNTIKGLSLRLESMAKFIDALTVPAAKEPANLHRGLACGLMAQAATSLLDYLETNSSKSKDNADVFVSQAKKELDDAKKFETNGVVITK